MRSLYTWAQRHGIPAAALDDLVAMLGAAAPVSTPAAANTPEGDVQNLIRMEASRKGCRIWRNNVGACEDNTGRFIRYGLANDSKRMNEVIKSSDLIGIKPVNIEPQHVGLVIGQFVAREVKSGGWKYRGTAREAAQLVFLNLVSSMGGDACFAASEGTL